MDYTSLNIKCGEELSEILTAELSDYPFESFTYESDLLSAYLPTQSLPSCRAEVDALLARYGVTGLYSEIPTENWNAAWESDFPPVEVDDRLLIRAPHHSPAPEGVMDVVLIPHMSFGTGHHATTRMMSQEILDLGVEGLDGLDVGTGTGVLAIVAAKCGARHVDAVDIDDLCQRSCRENADANGVGERITSILGDISRVEGRTYDFIAANIHRNILIAQMEASARLLRPGGHLLMSGFWADDVEAILRSGREAGLIHLATRSADEWRMIHLIKEPRS